MFERGADLWAEPIGEIRYGLGELDEQSTARLTLPERDLLRVALAVHAADRLSPRKRSGAKRLERELQWQREIAVLIEVEDPSRWQVNAPALTRLLHFLTDDSWDVQFSPSAQRHPAQAALLTDPEGNSPEVALFSGGLDSVAGLFVHHAEHRRPILAISSCGVGVREHAQSGGIRTLRSLGVRVAQLPFLHQLRSAPDDRCELPQRTRGFLFLSLAALAASNVAADHFSIYETGVGCLNTSLNEAQVGAQTTRAMHPGTLLLAEEIHAAVLDRRIRIDAPFFLATKGELCSRAGGALSGLAAAAMSCDEGEGHKPVPMEHCGLCTSCLFRRVALHSALGDADRTTYRDALSRGHDTYEIEAFQLQACRLASASRSFERLVALDPSVRYAIRFLERRGMTSAQAREALCDLYGRYSAETLHFFAHRKPVPHVNKRLGKVRAAHDLFAAAR